MNKAFVKLFFDGITEHVDQPELIDQNTVNAEARDLIADLRGGIPENCPFCHKPTPPEQMDPMSGGDWVCNECWDKWETEAKQEPFTGKDGIYGVGE